MIDIETRYGLFQAPATANDLICRFLRRYGEWGRNEVRFVADALPEGPIRVLDLGAFVGTFGIGLSAERAVGSLCFVEANPHIAPALRENVRRHAKAPSTVVEAALVPDDVPRTGVAEADNLGSLSFVAGVSRSQSISIEPARFLTLSELRREQGGFDLIKMDVEGLECALLAEDRAILKPGGPALWLECNPTEQSLELAELLLSAGLSVHYFAFPAFAADNFRGDPEPIFPFAFESGLWASRGPSPKLSDTLVKQGCMLRPIFNLENLRQILWRTPRWGMQEWQEMALENIVAEAAHLYQGEIYTDFLRPGAPEVPEHHKGLAVRELRALLADHEHNLQEKTREILETEQAAQSLAEALSHTQQVVLEKSDELKAVYIVLDDEQSRVRAMAERVRASEDIKAVLETRIAFGEQKTAAAEEARRAAEGNVLVAEQNARDLEQALHVMEHRVQAIESSTIWRASRLIRAFLGRHPKLRALLRAPLAKVYRSLRLVVRGNR